MSASRVAFVLLQSFLLLSGYMWPLIMMPFASITTLALSFQPLKTNRIRQQGVRQSDGGAFHRIQQKGLSPSFSSPYRIHHETFLRLSSSPKQAQEQQHPETETIERDLGSLSEWARDREIVLADCIDVREDLLGDWSLSTTKSIEQGSSILTVPLQVVLTSDVDGDSYLPHYSEANMQSISLWMESELESGPQAKQDYLPEYMLVYKLIREVHLGSSSRWYAWLRSLPTKFSTGLYLDEVERDHVERMTGEYVRVQRSQYDACLELFQKLISSQERNGSSNLMPRKFLDWMLTLQEDTKEDDSGFDDLVKWAFTVVFTRSWRSPDRKHAQIVPIGDLANHDSQFANLKPGFRETDDAFEFFVTSDIDVTSPQLYLSYGLTYAPARFLVLFGFCDVTAGYIDAQIDFLQDNENFKWPTTLEPSQLVVSTFNGALAEEVWIAFLYKKLREDDPEMLTRIRKVFGESKERGEEFLEQILDTVELSVGLEIQEYYQRLMETDFTPIAVTERDLVEHPNLSMIVNYNIYMRETFLGVLKHVNEFLTQCKEFQELTASEGKSEADISENSILQFKSKSSQQYDRTAAAAVSSRNYTANTTTVESSSSVSGQVVSLENNNSGAVDEECDSNPLTNVSTKVKNLAEKKAHETISSNSLPDSATKNVTEQSFSVSQEPEENIALNATLEFPGNNSGQVPDSVGQMSSQTTNSNATSRFSSENFKLQSYLEEATKTSEWNSDSRQTYSLDPTARPSIPIENFNPQFNSGSQTTTNEETINSTAADVPYEENGVNLPYASANPESFSLDQSSEEIIDQTLTPDLLYGNLNSQQEYSDSNAAPSQEMIHSAATSNFQDETSEPMSYSMNQTEPYSMNQTETYAMDQTVTDSMDQTVPTDNRVDFMASYAQSLISDQRGDPSQDQLGDGGTHSLSPTSLDIISPPSTYSEYLQQRQKGFAPSDQQKSESSTIEMNKFEDSVIRYNASIQVDDGGFGASDNYQI